MATTPKQPIRTFLDTCRTSGTAYAYRTGIIGFLDYVYGNQRKGRTATQAEFKKYEELAAKYLKEKRDNSVDVIGFIRKMKEGGTPPKSVNIRVCGVKGWLTEHDVILSDKQKKHIKDIAPRGTRKTNFKFASREIIREIIAQGDSRLRALVLTLASSGCRIDEVLKLKWSDVTIPDRTKISEADKLTRLFIADSKTGVSRYAWITREAEEAILEWRKATPAYLKTVRFKGKNLNIDKSETDNRVFPYARDAARMQWLHAVKTASHYTIDERTHRNQLNIHRLRGFFKTATMPIIGADYSELLMGHSDRYGNAYRDLPEDKLATEYAKCEAALTIATVHGVGKQIASIQDENQRLKERIAEMERVQTDESRLFEIFKKFMADQQIQKK